ncbi:MAG: CHAD domain-containing protein [Hyphomicrobium sp.]|nr:CHAD domain-containing protein [Hyphomicrobium sp.]
MMAYRVKFNAELEKDVRRLLSAQVGRAIGHLTGVLDDGGSAIHATRKSLKRCRSILRLVRPGLSRADFRTCDLAFRDIGRLLSHDRDSEVMTETLTQLAADAETSKDKAALAAALNTLGADKLNGYAHTQATQNTDAAIGRLHDAEHAIHALKVKHADITTLAAGFADTYSDGRKALKKAYRAQDDEAFHTFRKALQHHWRHCQLLVQVWPEMMDVRIAAAREQSQLIGIDHDLSLLTAHFSDTGSSKLEPDIRQHVCALAKAEQTRIRSAAKPLARRLYALPPADLERMILKTWPAAKSLARHRRRPSAAALTSSGQPLPAKDASPD